ncbi:GFA family protein [Bordetella genomosp. 13]|uniref:GFA family protein n=1 Tax=Bordetella genomosp. 13 TaxID=463040 RepID=UPI0011A40BD5|nr:GFA family protein [Bordetella genomosp. 13]
MQETTSGADAPLTGGCQCGAVRYALSAGPITAATCHCRDCQYSSGGAPAHALIVPADAIRVSQGQPRQYRYAGGSGREVMRSFCPDCGTPLFGSSDGVPYAVVRAGSLDDPEAFRPRVSLWTASAPSWHHVADDAPAFPGNAPV